MLLFPKLMNEPQSRLSRLRASEATAALIQQSPAMLCGREAILAQMEMLRGLVNQTSSYRLLLGTDAYKDPVAVSELLSEALAAQDE